jgi:lysozyme
MKPRLAVSRSAVELIKAFEGFRSAAAQLDDGRWTIGYGHTLTAREGAKIAEPDAEALLLYDLIQVSHAVNEHVFAPLTQNQFDALVSFVFNIGVRNFRGSTTLRRLNEGRALEAAIAMEMWRKADLEGERIVVDALVRRRAAEKALFLTPMEGWMAAPTPVLAPKVDYDAVGVLPLQSPVATRTSMGGDRAFAEREPEWPFEPPEGPSASEAAAEAVIDRLESLLSDADASAPASAARVAEPEASADAAPPGPAANPTTAAAPSAARRRRAHPLTLLALGVVGVVLFMLAALWLVTPPAAAVAGLPAPAAGLVTGGVGALCFASAAYFLLERLGLPRERAAGS